MTFADSGNGSAIVTFSPDFTNPANSYVVTFRAIDRMYPADSSFGATVSFVVGVRNVAPVLDPIGPKSVVEGVQLQFLVTASDSNLTTPLIAIFDAPTGAVFSFVTGSQYRFTWTPTFTQSGVYYPLFR